MSEKPLLDVIAEYDNAPADDNNTPVDDVPADGGSAHDSNAASVSVTYAIVQCTQMYIRKLDRDNMPSPTDMERELVSVVKDYCDMQNATLPKTRQLKAPDKLTPWQIAQLMMTKYRIRIISSGDAEDNGGDDDPVGVYMTEGQDAGLYVLSDKTLRKIAGKFSRTASKQELDAAIAWCWHDAEVITRTMDRDLVPLDNGIYNYKTRELIPYSPEYVFVSKSPIAYVENATNPVIKQADGTTWDVETWLRELSDDPDVVDLLWQLIGASVRPLVGWNKAALLYNPAGENGKGTLVTLIKGLVGARHCATVPIANFSKDFALEPLLRASCVVADENDIGDFARMAANFKAAVTGDVIQLNRKNKAMINYRFMGLIIQCINELPRTRDKSDSFYRRLLMIPFGRCFTGNANTAIKDDYVRRQDVLEYVLWRVLNMDPYYALSEPDACKELLNEYKEYNDPVRQFLLDLVPQFKWGLMPAPILYALYKAWFKQNIPSGSLEGRNAFLGHVAQVLPSLQLGWAYDPKKRVRVTKWDDGQTQVGSNLYGPEPLIFNYEVTEWYNKTCKSTSNDPDKLSTLDHIQPSYYGMVKM